MILFEIKKILSRTGSKVGLLVLLITLVVSCYFAIEYTTYVDEEARRHTGITAINNLREEKEEWTGVMTEDYLKEVIRKNNEINSVHPYDPGDPVSSDIGYSMAQGIEDIKIMINCAFGEFRSYNYLRVDSVTEDEVGNLYENRIRNVKTWLSSDGVKDQYSEAEKEYIIGSYETLKIPFYYESWMSLVEKVKDAFPGLETKEALNEHKNTVLDFMGRASAICAKEQGEIVGTLLFSNENNEICFLAVDAEHRRQHVAEKMVSFMLTKMDPQSDIFVTTYRDGVPEGTAARAFYKRIGFTEGKLTEEFGSPVQEFVLKR